MAGGTLRRDHLADSRAQVVLQRTVETWFVTLCAGQWLFLVYVILHYIAPALREGLKAWTGNNLATGYLAGDTWGNLAVASHIFLAVAVIGGGQWQLVPGLRTRFPSLHRGIGYLYLTATVILALTGFHMLWVRGDPQAGLIEHLGTTLGGVLILTFAPLALYAARHRRFAAHRRWTIRLFLTTSGVWFIRVGYGLWYLFGNGTPAGFHAFSIFISYAQYLLPLAGFELYLLAKNRNKPSLKITVSGLLVVSTLLMIAGIHQATLRLWLPRLTEQAAFANAWSATDTDRTSAAKAVSAMDPAGFTVAPAPWAATPWW